MTLSSKKEKLSAHLGKLAHKKKITKKAAENEVEILLNDFDLDANEIFSWFRGATDSISLSAKPRIEKQETKVNSSSMIHCIESD